MDGIPLHRKLEMRNSEVSDDSIDQYVIGGDVSHASQFHRSGGIHKLEGFQSAGNTVRKLKHTNVTDLIYCLSIFMLGLV